MQHTAWIVAATAIALHANDAAAQTWPARPIRAIIPFAAGSFTDVMPRVVFDQVSKQLGQPIVVENRTGAGGTIGVTAVVRAEPDGHTILTNSSAHTIAPAIYPNLAYDTAKDLAAVISLGQTPMVMIMSPAKGHKTVQSFVKAAREKPDAINFVSAGVGSATHLAAERFIHSAGIKAVHIPHRGGTEAMTDVIAGRVDFYFCPLGTALPQINTGRVLALAVSSPKRTAALPDVPTTLEAGYADSDYTFWMGIFMPAKTPPEIVVKFHRELAKALDAPAVKEKLLKLGVESMPLSPAQFDAQVKREIGTYATFAKDAGMQAN